MERDTFVDVPRVPVSDGKGDSPSVQNPRVNVLQGFGCQGLRKRSHIRDRLPRHYRGGERKGKTEETTCRDKSLSHLEPSDPKGGPYSSCF